MSDILKIQFHKETGFHSLGSGAYMNNMPITWARYWKGYSEWLELKLKVSAQNEVTVSLSDSSVSELRGAVKKIMDKLKEKEAAINTTFGPGGNYKTKL